MACSVYKLAPKSRVVIQREAFAAGVEVPLTIEGRSKAETYAAIDRMLGKFLAAYPLDLTGRMATLNSFLYANFPRMNFCGFYTTRVAGELLQIGPYMGDMLACGTIAWGKGVCGTAAASGTTQIVRDVRAVENYIACDEETLSEIVVPVYARAYHNEPPAPEGAPKKLIAVLDIDGDALGAFDEEDAAQLQALLEKHVCQ